MKNIYDAMEAMIAARTQQEFRRAEKLWHMAIDSVNMKRLLNKARLSKNDK